MTSRIRVYAIGMTVLTAAIMVAMAGRPDATSAAPQNEPAVTVGQESIHVVGGGAVSTGR